MNRTLSRELQNRRHTPRRRAREARRARRVAGSFVLYVFIGTLALSAASTRASTPTPEPLLAPEAATSLVNPREINLRPFREFLETVRRRRRAGALKLDGVLELTLACDRNEDGTISNVAVETNQSDESFREIAGEFARRLDESRALQMLEGVEHLNMRLRLDEQNVSVRVENQFKSAARAQEKGQQWGSLLTIGRLLKRGQPEAIVLNNMRLSASGKQLVMSLEMSRAALGNLLLKQVTPN